ncbi:HU family DNA-binding protein [Methylobacillus sp.]|uniref:HU family DNA-binding protein n=1 Tax=Methylobacillus sp. TaxID=56818 RepID=UPI0012C3A068|nr:HU family DNA-binding protein [Methylobacillus sp.]MPS48487.1 HU family DNA-binding protein [Methylobacillus sp.]
MSSQITRKELAEYAASIHGISVNKADNLLKDVFKFVADNLQDGRKVSVHGFGTFEPRSRAPRVARNPLNGASIEVPARVAVGFKVSETLKRTVNE